MSDATCLKAAAYLLAIEVSLFTWLLSELTLWDIGMGWLALGGTALIVESIIKDLRST